ncbi:MAG: bifunctional YncE family protein/alkaline phosphatase family protein [Deltaproteobacteria bacterium]|jgi:DNA-binding beta-propeller fold protein YncE
MRDCRPSVLPLVLVGATAGCDPQWSPDGSASDAAPIDVGADGGPAGDAGNCRRDLPDRPPTEGRCWAREADPLARHTAGEEDGAHFIVPGGERLVRVGRNLEVGGFPMRLVEVPGTDLVVVTDGGLRDETLAVVDLQSMTILDQEIFRPSTGSLFWGLVVSGDGATRRVWASGGGANEILAYDLDVETGALREVADDDIALTGVDAGYVAGLALTGTTLVAAVLREQAVAWFDTRTGIELRRVSVERSDFPYDVVLSPDGARAYVSLWGGSAVAFIDLASGAIEARVSVGKNPEGLALSADGRRLAVACADSDSIVLIDTTTRTVLGTHRITAEDGDRGASPASLRFSPDGRQLLVATALDNAIDVLDATDTALPRLGRIPTLWHPTDVLPRADGSVAFLNGRDLGTGANRNPSSDDITELLGGSLSLLDTAPSEAELRDWEIEIEANNTRMSRFVEVECPDGAPYDFPIPRPGEGPSTAIRHVVVIVRENKTFDAYMGALGGVDGDPSLTLLPVDELATTIPNTHQLARQFGLADNHYSHAEQSVQGHVWATLGRTTDFVERSWLTTWGRGHWSVPPQATTEIGYPEEGSGFDYLHENGIEIANYGEIVGTRNAPLRRGYPGLFYSYESEVAKADFLRDAIHGCQLESFTFVLMPNDHTQGLTPGEPTPRSMIADNDEGVGRLVDAISHSSFWPETVVFVFWDDPQDGGDHVDNHRSPLLVISPWARRGHVSHVHTSEASVWRTIQLIFGLEGGHSREWTDAAPLYDFFTSSPDFTPYDHIPRTFPEELNPDMRTRDAMMSMAYDWSLPDDQPGLSRMLWRHFHGGLDAPWPERDIDESVDEGEAR